MTPRVFQQVDVQMRRVHRVRLGAKVVRGVINVVHLFGAGPLAGVAGGRRKTGAQILAPFGFVALVECSRVECAQGIAANALDVLEYEAEFRFVGQVRTHKNAA